MIQPLILTLKSEWSKKDIKHRLLLNLWIYYVSVYFSALKFSSINIMRKINPKCDNNESFMYSILISLNYYDIYHNPERITKLRPYVNNNNFTNTRAKEFEVNNQHVSLEILDEDGNIIYSPSNTSKNKAVIVKISGCRYAAIKPIKNKYSKLREIL